MAIEARIQADLQAAMRSGDEVRKRTLRLLLAALRNAAIEHRGPLDEEAEMAVLRRQAKQRRDAMTEFERGSRPDLVAIEAAELEVLSEYLPPAPDDAAIEAAARAAIAAAGATGPADMGKVMGPLLKELGPDADGGRVSAIVRRLLAA
jgi:uncharacterized protein YqeY